MENWYDYQDNNINDFIKNYRESLLAQRDSNLKQLQQQRRNYMGSIMGAANRRGMLYSNFPQRDKINYDTNTYNPAVVKNQTSYQTGLDTLRNNAVTLWNKIQSYNESTNDLNNYGITGSNSGGNNNTGTNTNTNTNNNNTTSTNTGNTSTNNSKSNTTASSAQSNNGLTVWDWLGGLSNPLLYFVGKGTHLF